MKELAALLAGLGLNEVRTYIQSGNVVFRGKGPADTLSERIRAAMARRFGFRPYLALLKVVALARAVAANPFPAEQSQPTSLHLWFLERSAPVSSVKSLQSLRAADERFAVRGKVLYLHAPRGVGKSKFAARAESVLGVSATARNWRTVTELLRLARSAR